MIVRVVFSTMSDCIVHQDTVVIFSDGVSCSVVFGTVVNLCILRVFALGVSFVS